MNNNYNQTRPLIMHIDLNSCFATVEQQSRPILRGRPVAIVNRRTDNTSLVTASYEAKALGVKVGMKLRDAKLLAPGLVALESDPAKYRFVYHKLLGIMSDYSSYVTMKSIDEGIIDFNESTAITRGRTMESIGHEIKQRLRDEVGVWMRCNVGIGTNRFLAKTAAGLHKPDGLDEINYQNLRSTFSKMKLTDLTGIAERNEARLNSVGIYTPLQFLDADVATLQKVVFKSVVGQWWHQRLRGYEVDDVSYEMKRVGRQYVLDSFNLTHDQIIKRLHHLCESVGSRMRAQGKSARGVYVYAKTYERGVWHASFMATLPFYSDQTIFALVRQLFLDAPDHIREIGVHCYELQDLEINQLSLFNDQIVRERRTTDAIDEINKRFGDRTIHSADTLGTGIYVKQKVPFGSTRYL